MRRRSVISGMAALLSMPALRLRAQTRSAPSTLLDTARGLAAQDYVAPTAKLQPPFAGLDYDAYRGIRPIPGRASVLPQGQSFAVDLLPPGLFFRDTVEVELPDGDGFAPVSFASDLFDFDPRYFDAVPSSAQGAGFSGLRLRHPLNAPDQLDEVLVMQGASYFRAIGQAMAYGLSARAVALGTGGPTPEEFPRFTRLRLHRAGLDSVRIEAVIDSPSMAGHLDMTLKPGPQTDMDITVTILPRRRIDDIAIAPLTSMYLKGPMRASVSDDFRPRVHDSDVLVIENGAGERLWRPIANPAKIETSAFLDDEPAAFGLWQLPRTFEDFEDSEARYHDRPSCMVRPIGDWGRGAIMLVEIPTGDEFMDNINAFWRPEAALEARSEHRFAYSLIWTRADPLPAETLAIRQSRSGREHDQPGKRRFVIDFMGDAVGLTPDLSATSGAALSGLGVFALPGGRGTRVTFLLAPGGAGAVDLRLVLRRRDGTAASPVWLHRWTRTRDGGV